MPTPLEIDFHEAMMNIYRRAQSEAGYNVVRFKQMLGGRDGVDCARAHWYVGIFDASSGNFNVAAVRSVSQPANLRPSASAAMGRCPGTGERINDQILQLAVLSHEIVEQRQRLLCRWKTPPEP